MKLQVSVEPISSWSSGGSGMLKITNLGDTLDGWCFPIETPNFKITNLYNFEYKRDTKEVCHKSWTKTFSANQTRESGFTYSGVFETAFNFIADGSTTQPIEVDPIEVDPKPDPDPVDSKPDPDSVDPKPDPDPVDTSDEVWWKNIPYLYPTNPSVPMWTSEHWHNGNARSVSNSNRDPDDPSKLSQKRGSGSFKIDGNGILTMGGSQPRIYINGDLDGDNVSEARFFKNTETTVYYKRTGTDGANWGGIVVGSRSSPNGHSSGGDNYKTTHTHYARVRHDGKMDFEKELTHSPSAWAFNDQVGLQQKYFDGLLPADKWYGFKFVIYNISDKHVRLEMYLDEVSNGEADKIGDPTNWKKLGQMNDTGKWKAPIISKYEGQVDPFQIISKGGGVTFIRNTGADKAEYKYFSVREIVAPGDETEVIIITEPDGTETEVPTEPEKEQNIECVLHNLSQNGFTLQPNTTYNFVAE